MEKYRKNVWKKSNRRKMEGEANRKVRHAYKPNRFVWLCLALIMIGLTQWIMGYCLFQEADITEAFAASKSSCVETRVQVTADYGTDFLTEKDKQQLIRYLAGTLGIRTEVEPVKSEKETATVYEYEIAARYAKSSLKVITMKEDTSHTYLFVELVLYEDSDYEILVYRDRILKGLQKLGVENAETTLQFLGAYEGELPATEWERISDDMVKRLNGKIIYANRDPRLYTIYAYTALLSEYICSNDFKVNIQVAMKYEEDTNRTVIYLATPILRSDW